MSLYLFIGSGVDGAIHKAAGPELLEACRKVGGCETGEAVMTKAFGILQAKVIIHTVGPRIHDVVDEKSRSLLSNCYINSLRLAAPSHRSIVSDSRFCRIFEV